VGAASLCRPVRADGGDDTSVGRELHPGRPEVRLEAAGLHRQL